MKGYMGDVLVIMAFLFGLVITLFFVYPIVTQFFNQMSDINQDTTQVVQNEWDRVISIADKAIPVVYLLLLLVSFVSAARIGANPAFFIFMLFLNLVMMLGWYILDQFYQTLTTTDITSELSNKLTWTPLILQWVPAINIIMMLMIAFVQYMK